MRILGELITHVIDLKVDINAVEMKLLGNEWLVRGIAEDEAYLPR